ncbi:MAG: methionyl-tRNA formyltransferase [Candidatus Latescibacteria bacterium]|jgi:methionyl-tRNA formyltransferase|nr:methionyl-tRNA formyltransferase [Candidatus Latescibacterota bacterium]
MGTPQFAVPTLQALAESRHQLAAVVTNPDRPQGRGRQLAPPPVKECAQTLGIDVLQPASIRDPGLAAALSALAPDLFVVVAFSILPGKLLAIPRLGSVNLHPSLLPAYRGAAPIIWAVVNGEQETGISTFQLNPRVDAGDILLQRRVGIGPDETAGELEARLCRTGAEMVVETVDGLEDGTLSARPQDSEGTTRAPKLDKEDGRIDWQRPAAAIRNQIRGMNPVPGAFTTWQGQPLKIHRAECADGAGAPGTVRSADDRQGPVVACGAGALLLTEVQPAGKAAMEGTAFARGYPIAAGALLGA